MLAPTQRLLAISVGTIIRDVALPTMPDAARQLPWIVGSHMLPYAGLLLAAGTLGDRFGRRRALAGTATFTTGSGLAA